MRRWTDGLSARKPDYEELRIRCERAEAELDALRTTHDKAQARETHIKRILLAIRNVNQLIVAEPDATRLAEKACESLTETLGYLNAWIALLDEAGDRTTIAAASGFAGTFGAMGDRLERGQFPACMRKALSSDETVVVDHPSNDCPDCPLACHYERRSGLARRLENHGRVYGVLTVSVPRTYATDAEAQQLFREVANDIAFALRKIEMEDAVREDHQRIEFIIEGANLGTWVWNVQTNETTFNEIWAQMLGYTIEELSPYDYQTWARLVHPDDLPHAVERLTQCREGESSDYECEIRMQHKDGSWVWILDRGRVLTRDEDGRPLSMFGTHTDITEMKRADKAYVRICRMASELICLADLQTATFLQVNPAFMRVLGYTEQELLNRPFLEFVHPDDMEPTIQIIEDKLRSGEDVIRFENRYRHKDGSYRLLQWNSHPVVEEDKIYAIAHDITESRRAQRALTESAQRIQAIVSAANVGLWDWDLETNRIAYSAEWKRQIGYEEDEIGNGFEEWESRVHPDDLPHARAHVERAIAERNDHYQLEFRFRHKNGSYIWILAQASILKDETGKPVRTLGSHIDITEQKQAQERIVLLSEMLDAAPVAITIHDTEGWFLYANQKTLELHGYKSEEFARLNLRDLDVPESQELIAERMDQIISEGEARFEVRHFRKDGSTVPLEVHDKRTDWKGEPAFISIASDITERREAEEELRRRESLLQRIFDILPVGLWIVDRTGKLLRGNPEGVRIWGAEPTVAPEDYGVFKARFLPSGKELCPEDWSLVRTIRDGEIVTNEMLEIDAFDGQKRIILNSTAPVLDTEGNVESAIVVNEDITAHQALEHQYREAQKMEAIGQLTGGVAHDFNNLLQVINGNADLALADLDKNHPVHGSITQILQAGQRAAGLVEQLLAFGRRRLMRPQVLDLDNTITDIIKMLRRVIGEHVRMEWTPGIKTGSIYADRGMVEQALVNLCVNARDAMPDGGTLSIQTDSANLDAEFCARHDGTEPGRYAILSVIDTGVGIEHEHLEHIFEPFFTTKELGKGTGLGLATVYGIVKQHQGMIDAHSEPGSGAAFLIYLPMCEQETPSDENESPQPVRGGTETILIAEDEEAVRRLAARALRRHGYHVLEAADGAQALDRFIENARDIDLVLLDVVMPNVGGRKAYEEIRQLRPNVRVVFTSGYSEGALHTNFVLESGLVLLQKPYTHQNLLITVRKTLDE